MTLQQLTYFLATAEHGSFSAAADALHMAQPSLSEQVRRLEQELGVALFSRVGRGLALTEAGLMLVPHAERTVASAEEAAESVREVRTLAGGTVTFGTFGSAPSYLISDLVRDFRTKHPAVRVRVIGQNSSQVAESVREGRIEAAMVALPIDDRGLDVRPAIRDEVLFISADESSVTEPMTIQRLAERPLILYDATYGWEDPTRRQLIERAQRAGVRIEPQIEVEDIEAALDLAARGLGDTLAPRKIAVGRGYSRRLNFTQFSPPLWDTYAFITRRNAHLSPATRAFIEIAERRIQFLGRRVSEDTAEHAVVKHPRRRADDL